GSGANFERPGGDQRQSAADGRATWSGEAVAILDTASITRSSRGGSGRSPLSDEPQRRRINAGSASVRAHTPRRRYREADQWRAREQPLASPGSGRRRIAPSPA